ncbi:hypothetical protein NIES37_37530 [Tolypothrix tenuis PCC 7101]|uniref:Uncharacterized protein n=1 Tax=Tolypothrix tenuis PCC 7101 TaxID=231146 RepID=A0A1Z4N254_9CYAN|nr:hypothetical protein [Aulosira sp. FACHB-113]BAY99770.1 hypothetical protein NIES37_37530 [Tolypothrix tenuis PCC 7101]BAZ76308.1 hypothetical protein NIES50_49060 [Aulosira laxa NIES-50]
MRLSSLIHTTILTASLFTTYVPNQSAITLAGTPNSRTVKEDVPICYIQTSNGRIINLAAQCGYLSPDICFTSLGSPERDVVLAEFCKKNEKCLQHDTCNNTPPPLNPTDPEEPLG